MKRLRVVVLVSAPVGSLDIALLRRLTLDPNLSICGIVGTARSLRSSGNRQHAIPGVHSWIHRLAWWAFDKVHSIRAKDDLITVGQGFDIPVRVIKTWQSPRTLGTIRELDATLGVHLGESPLPPEAASIPPKGIISMKDGAPTGYRELVARERCVSIRVCHVVGNKEPSELTQTTIDIEECDTLESIRLKTKISAVGMIPAALRIIADGIGPSPGLDRDAVSQRVSERAARILARRLRRTAEHKMPVLRVRPSVWARLRVTLQYCAILPMLLYQKTGFLKGGRAPILILFYHLVANRPLNRMCLPLELFVCQIEFMRRYYDLLSLQDAVQRVRSGRNDNIGVAITFDDGYQANYWAIEYLKAMKIPATFFVSVGHIEDGVPFEHDRNAGFENAVPMSVEELVKLANDGFLVGSHGVYHEDFGQLKHAAANEVLVESRAWIARVTGSSPEHFSFPKGQRGINITRESFELALEHYSFVHSAYGGYNFPSSDQRHFLRFGDLHDVSTLARALDGYISFRQCLFGDSWGMRTNEQDPF